MKETVLVSPFKKPIVVITTPPTKTVYRLGEKFDPTGMVVTGFDSKGRTYTINDFDYMEPQIYTTESQTYILQDVFVPFGANIVKVSQPVYVIGKDKPEPTITPYALIAQAKESCSSMFNEVTVFPNSAKLGSTVAYRAVCKENYKFLGWYDANDNLVSTESSFTMPVNLEIQDRLALYAKAINKDTQPVAETPNYLYFVPDSSVDVTVSLDLGAVDNNYYHDLFYSYDKATWYTWKGQESSSGNRIIFEPISVQPETRLYVKGSLKSLGKSKEKHSRFNINGKADIRGNLISLIDQSCQSTVVPTDYCFYELFKDQQDIRHADLILPYTDMKPHAFEGMFKNCEWLRSVDSMEFGTKAASDVADYAYASMFENCTALTNMPNLPSTNLSKYFYKNMFAGCESLEAVKTLPALVLAEGCYQNMFMNAKEIAEAPTLPATTLAPKCYQGMFKNCTGIVTSPELLAEADAEECYEEMFQGCTALVNVSKIKAAPQSNKSFFRMFKGCNVSNMEVLFTTYLSQAFGVTATEHLNWLGHSQTGTFKCPEAFIQNNALNLPPTGWTVINS